MIRGFVAIAIPARIAGPLELAQAGLPAGRPVPLENLHLTLAFLGKQPEPVLEDVHYALEGIRAPSFDVSIVGTGLFGSPPRALYAGIAVNPLLSRLRDKVVNAARGAGVEMPRSRFHPHVTLARFGQGLRGEDIADIEAFAARRMGLSVGPFPVEAYSLFRSTLGRHGPTYDELASYPLQSIAAA